ncbi:major allergen Pru av 1-like [Humulus lupulus]|uniref:major allergen Pru av 1-like n=1 Tax=Humulus lupulus TaxID=3486 RepID=UPI002B40B322|nr:major allergen Pru av 1-like [Humulus lupulus]
MGVFTYETETISSIPPARLFKAFFLDADNLIPKVVPQAIKSTEILEGNGGPGTIKKISFGEGSQYKYVKHQVDAVDADNFRYNYTVIEGDALGDVVEKINYETNLVASADGGSIVKSISKYHTKGGHEIKEDHIKEGKEKASHLFKAIEAYLVANPDAYN